MHSFTFILVLLDLSSFILVEQICMIINYNPQPPIKKKITNLDVDLSHRCPLWHRKELKQ